MSWLFSQALVEEFSEATCSDGEPSAQLNVMPTPHKFSRQDKTIEPSDLSRFGLTCAVLTEDRGAALLTWYLAGSRARTCQSLEAAPASMASAVASGQKWPGSFAKLSQDESTWRTHQLSLDGGWQEFSGTWPRWGWMRDGECSVLAPMVHHIHARGCSWWPTPVATDHKRGKGSPAHRLANGRAVVDRPSKSRFGATLPDILGGTPNPEWIEWLMGWPTNWTALRPLETDRFQSWLRPHSIFSAAESKEAA
ncbi:hypothetical protein LMG26788_03733 [Achromobacter pulmonis]|uniref:Uncharacterized protein n=1 Tax=Achromobacter pulmonis TaxID=1389932 RepID=A0A6S7DFK4_9BURK|nr:hypothetical protein LMG26788_03667 [Achromobacter pulmonis]CAB3890150.1 hypothetical protein LMG26788_03733 [Achromobacter pulmonis]